MKKQGQANKNIDSLVSMLANKVKAVVRIIHIDEEWMIAKTVSNMININ